MKYAIAAFLLVLAFSTAFIFKISDTEKFNLTQTLPTSTNDNRWNDKFFVGAMDDDGDHSLWILAVQRPLQQLQAH